MVEPKIGLALGSGGSRGFAHIGVLKVLKEENIKIDFIAGSSMGALIGVLYSAGYEPDVLEKLAIHFRRKYLLDFTVPKMGFIKGEKAKQLIKMLVQNKRLEDLSPKVSVVTTNLMNGEKVIFQEGDITKAVRASIAIPGIVVPEVIDGELYVDGGVVDRVPVTVAKNMGADITIGVDVSFFNKQPEITTIYDVMMQSMDIMEKEMLKYREIDTDVLVRPITSQISSLQFTNVKEIILLGEDEMRKQLPKLKKKIKSWKGKQHGEKKQ